MRCSDLIHSGAITARQLTAVATGAGTSIPADWRGHDYVEPLGALQAVVYAQLRHAGCQHEPALRACAGLKLGCPYPGETAWLHEQFDGYCVAVVGTTVAYVRDPRDLPPGPMLVVRLADSVETVSRAVRGVA